MTSNNCKVTNSIECVAREMSTIEFRGDEVTSADLVGRKLNGGESHISYDLLEKVRKKKIEINNTLITLFIGFNKIGLKIK